MFCALRRQYRAVAVLSHLAARDIMVALKATVLSFPLCARESRREGGGEGGEDGEGGKGGRVDGGKTESDDKRWKPKSDPD